VPGLGPFSPAAGSALPGSIALPAGAPIPPLAASRPAASQPAASQPASSQPTSAPAAVVPVQTPEVPEEVRLAAESLRDSAEFLVHAPADTPYRAGRIYALAKMADRLQPGHPRTNWILAGIYQAQGKDAELAKSLAICLAAQPDDALLGSRYLRLNLDMLDTAERRAEYLRAFVDRNDIVPALRSEGWANLGRLMEGQGRPQEAQAAYEQAMSLDPGQPDAIQGSLALQKDAAPPRKLAAVLGLLKSSPRRADLAMQAASLLENLGLYTPSLVFYDQAWSMAQQGADRDILIVIAARYCNAMLSAKEYQHAIEVFTRVQSLLPSVDLMWLLHEAYVSAGDTIHAGQMRMELRRMLRERYTDAVQSAMRAASLGESATKPAATEAATAPASSTAPAAPTMPAGPAATSRPSPATARFADSNAVADSNFLPLTQPVELPTPYAPRQAAGLPNLAPSILASEAVSAAARDLAWYFTVTEPEPNLATFFVKQAAVGDPNNPVIQRIMGMAELMSKQTEAGIDRLRPLAETDAYAARAVAEYHYRRAEANMARQVILQGLKAGRSGPAFRRLAALAEERRETIPIAAGAVEADQIYSTFDLRYLEMTRAPNRFVSVKIEAVKDPTLPGEALAVEAVLTNLSNIEVPIGEDGLLAPRLALSAKVGGVSEPFEDLPVISWPVPRQLPPRRSYAARVRLDVGAMGRLLAQHPLDECSIQLNPMLSPVQRGGHLISAVPDLPAPSILLTRKAMVDLTDANTPALLAAACKVRLGNLVYAFINGDLPGRMLAMRQTASLLALQRLKDMGKVSLPKPVADALYRPTLLSMVLEGLKDRSDTVRAELLAALQQTPMDAKIMERLAAAINDPSPLVRVRLAELLGSSGLSGQKPVLDFLAQDRDERVRAMVAAVTTPGSRSR
jgi:tetratricopeptide (TPR) repeat protein